MKASEGIESFSFHQNTILKSSAGNWGWIGKYCGTFDFKAGYTHPGIKFDALLVERSLREAIDAALRKRGLKLHIDTKLVGAVVINVEAGKKTSRRFQLVTEVDPLAENPQMYKWAGAEPPTLASATKATREAIIEALDK